MTVRAIASALAASVLFSAAPAPAQADAVSDFYKGKNVSLYVGYTAGGGYDVYARLLSRHFGKYMPGNPNIVVQNMPGAGSVRLANWLHAAAPKDGTVFGTIARGVAFDPLFGQAETKLDATKASWIGSMNDEVSVCVAWHTSGIKTFEETLTKELVVGGTGGAADTDQFPKVLNGVFNTKFRVVVGYPGGNDINIAMERGEVSGRCGWSWSSVISTRPDWMKDKKVNVLVQLSLAKHEDLPDVPLVTDLAKTPEQKAMLRLVFARQVMGRPFVGPPGIPADRLAALRKAFLDTQKDAQFLEEAKKSLLEITPVPGEKIEELVKEAYATPKPIVDKVAELLK
jgi:tripartite-type tricarboxylate transporter receptor subunit TctC